MEFFGGRDSGNHKISSTVMLGLLTVLILGFIYVNSGNHFTQSPETFSDRWVVSRIHHPDQYCPSGAACSSREVLRQFNNCRDGAGPHYHDHTNMNVLIPFPRDCTVNSAANYPLYRPDSLDDALIEMSSLNRDNPRYNVPSYDTIYVLDADGNSASTPTVF